MYEDLPTESYHRSNVIIPSSCQADGSAFRSVLPSSSHRNATQDNRPSLLWTEQKVHSHRAHSVTITQEFESFRLAPDGPAFSCPNRGDASTWMTVGDMGRADDAPPRGRNWEEREPGRDRIPHRDTTLVCLRSSFLLTLY